VSGLGANVEHETKLIVQKLKYYLRSKLIEVNNDTACGWWLNGLLADWSWLIDMSQVRKKNHNKTPQMRESR
jgi:hypothetical protein